MNEGVRVVVDYLHPPHFHPWGVGIPWRCMSHEHSVRLPRLHAAVTA